MNHYEVNFIIDPVLSGDEIKSTAGIYETLLKDQGCTCLLYTSDAADERSSVDLGGRRIIKKKKR